MRKSISVTFFSMVATLLVLGTAVLGCSEWPVSYTHLDVYKRQGGNWSWRAADGFDTAALAKRILAECAVYCRT